MNVFFVSNTHTGIADSGEADVHLVHAEPADAGHQLRHDLREPVHKDQPDRPDTGRIEKAIPEAQAPLHVGHCPGRGHSCAELPGKKRTACRCMSEAH